MTPLSTPLVTGLLWPAQPPPDDSGGGSNPVTDFLGDQASSVAESAFSSAMQALWDSAIWLLKGGFDLADKVSQVSPGDITGNDADNPAPIPGAVPAPASPGGAESAVDLGSLWSTMIWLAALIALGLFFYQLSTVALRGGRGMLRAVTGPVQFGIALAVTTGAVAVLLTGADGLTQLFLGNLGKQGSFTAIMDNPAVADRFGDNPDLGADVEDSVRSMILGVAALFGVIPAALGFALQMIFRAAAIMVLIATVPIAAACLMSDSTASVFWRVVRWILAAVLMKPALALVVVIGVNIMSRTQGVAGLLAGTAVLLISLFCPMVLYRLLAFVDPGTGAGMALRSAGGSRGGSSEPGSDGGTSESINIARQSGGGGESSAAGGELGGSTASPAATAGRAGAGSGAAGGAGAGGAGAGAAAGGAGGGAAAGGAGGGAAAGGAAGAAGALGGGVGAAVVAGYMATKAAGQAAGGYASGQMAQTGVGHPGAAPGAGPSGQEISSAASSASSWANSTPGPQGTYASGGESAPIESSTGAAGQGDTSGAGESPGPEPPSAASGPPEAGRPDSGSGSAATAGPGNEGSAGDSPPHEAPPAAAGPDGADTRAPDPGTTTPPPQRPQPRPAQSGPVEPPRKES